MNEKHPEIIEPVKVDDEHYSVTGQVTMSDLLEDTIFVVTFKNTYKVLDNNQRLSQVPLSMKDQGDLMINGEPANISTLSAHVGVNLRLRAQAQLSAWVALHNSIIDVQEQTKRSHGYIQRAYEKKLFTDLMALTESHPGSFLYKDFPGQDKHVFRIFSYEIPRTAEFKLPGAMDCRGTMFYVNTDNGEAKLLALPMRKFFSLGETVDSQKLDYKQASRAFIKEDGSLLTTYICPIDNKLKFKSQKMPTFKEYELVEKSVSPELYAELEAVTKDGYSFDLELTTPFNRVFMEYSDHNVHVLRARSFADGASIDLRSEAFSKKYPAITANLVKEIPLTDLDVNRKDIEGFVVEINGTIYKVKTIPYLSMSSVINMQDRSKQNEYMYEAALNEILDNIRSLYHYRRHSPNFPLEKILQAIDETEVYAKKTYKALIERVESLYEANKHLERGDYARSLKDNTDIMSILMDKYLGKPVDYKKAAVKIYGKKRD